MMTTSLSPNEFESLAAQLRRDGLPKSYVERVIDELMDHAAEIQSKGPFESRPRHLGSAHDLRLSIVTGYRAQTFTGRHPRVVFLLGSLLVAPAFCAIYVLAILGSFSIFGRLWGASSFRDVFSTTDQLALLEAVVQFGSASAYLAAAALTARVVYVSGSGSRWLLIAAGVQAAVAMFTSLSFDLALAAGGSSVAFTIGTSARLWSWNSFAQAAIQTGMPLIAARVATKRCFEPGSH